MLFTGGEVRLKPSTNQTNANTSYYPDVNCSQSNWRIKLSIVATVKWRGNSKQAAHNANIGESAPQVRNTATSYDISYTALCDHHLPSFLRGSVGVFFSLETQLSPQPPSLHGSPHFSRGNFKCVENERQ